MKQAFLGGKRWCLFEKAVTKSFCMVGLEGMDYTHLVFKLVLNVFPRWKKTWAACMTSRLLWSSDSIPSTFTHCFSSSHLLAECIKLSKNNHAFWYLEISQRISFQQKKKTNKNQPSKPCTEVAITRALHSIFEHGSTADNIHTTFFSFCFFLKFTVAVLFKF